MRKYRFAFGVVLGLIALFPTTNQLCGSNLVLIRFPQNFINVHDRNYSVLGVIALFPTINQLCGSNLVKIQFPPNFINVHKRNYSVLGMIALFPTINQLCSSNPVKVQSPSDFIDVHDRNYSVFGMIALFPTIHQLRGSNLVFDETFEESFEGTWIVTENDGGGGALKHATMRELNNPFELNGSIDGKQKKHAKSMNRDDFEPPPLVPAEMTLDPGNEKPEDGGERAKIPDINAIKAGHCVTPKSKIPIRESILGWCEREKSRKVRNPAHIGKRHSPPVDNPNYNSMPEAKEIPNPDYYELERPDFEPIAALGTKSCTTGDSIKRKMHHLLSKLVDFLKKFLSKLVEFLKMFKYKAELICRSQTTTISVTICYGQFCFFTWSYEIR